MTSPVLTVASDTKIVDGMQIMTTKKIRHFPIVDNGKLLGVVTLGDLVRAVLVDSRAQDRSFDEARRPQVTSATLDRNRSIWNQAASSRVTAAWLPSPSESSPESIGWAASQTRYSLFSLAHKGFRILKLLEGGAAFHP